MNAEKRLGFTGLTGRCHVEEIDEIRLETLEKACFFSEENQDRPLLFWVTEGTVYSAVDGRECTLRPGDLTLYPPSQYFVQYTEDDSPARVLQIRFHGQGLLKQTMCNRKFSGTAALSCLQTQILQELDDLEQNGADLLLCLLTQLLLLLQRQGEQTREEEKAARNPEHEIIRRAQAYVAAHVYDRLTVPLVADHARVSASYLTALFRKNLHISPGDYIRRAKLQQSRRLIRENRLNFTEIAKVLQYSTVHHFSRQFKDKFGISPTEYAKSVRESE